MFNSNQFVCGIAVMCDSFTTPSNGSIEISTDGLVTSASVTCSVGTTLVGQPLVECTNSGTWTVSSVSCGIFFL